MFLTGYTVGWPLRVAMEDRIRARYWIETAFPLQQAAEVPRAGVAALRLVRITSEGAPDARTVIDELGQAWQRYDAMDGTLYLIRPDGYVMGRWRVASTPADIHGALARAMKDSHE